MRPRQHYTQQLEAIHTELRALGQMILAAITQAIDALNRSDIEAARSIVDGDRRIDQTQYALESHVVGVIATQQPVASDLRMLIAAMEIASELERIGDYAKGIAKVAIRGTERPAVSPPSGISQMTEQVLVMLNSALEAFIQQDAAAARRLGAADDRVDELNRQVEAALIEQVQREPAHARRVVDLLFVLHNLERIADRTTNIGERVVYIATGEIVELNP